MGAQDQPTERSPRAPHRRTAATRGTPIRPAPTGPPSAPFRHDHLRVEAVTELVDLEALTDRWSALVRSSPQATAYASPAFVLTWYRHFERPGGIYAVTVWHGDELVGLAPFARTRLGYGPAHVTLLVSAGTEHGDYGDPLLGPHPGPVAAAIADHLAALVGRRTVINARRLRDDSPTLAALERRDDLATVPMGQVAEAAVVRLDQVDDPEAHLRRLAKKHSVPRRLRRRQVSDNAAFDPDPELAPYGLGQAEMAMMLDHAHASGAAEVDLRAGDFPYKHRWANATRTSRSVVLSAPGRQGDVMMALRRGAMSLRARRLARLRRHVPSDIGTKGRRWLAVVVVGVATGTTDAMAVELAA